MKNQPPIHQQRPRSFVVRILQDAQGEFHGQISEPSSTDGWRTTFTCTAQMYQLFAERLAVPLEPDANP